MTKTIKALLLLASIIPLATFGQPQIVGTWELVYVAPSDVMNTSPRGIANTKLYFNTDGKMIGLKPDQKLSDKSKFGDYQLNGKQLTILQDGKTLYTVQVEFPDEETMLFTPPYASQRKFKRIDDPNLELEPMSLQLVKTSAAQDIVSYDARDYTHESLEKRMIGVWEVTGFNNVPRDQLPPYGFLNDVYAIKKESIAISLRYAQKVINIPLSISDDNLALTDAVVGGRGEAKMMWHLSFDKWGHLVLDWQHVQIVLKLISKNTDHVPVVPLKVVLAGLAGE